MTINKELADKYRTVGEYRHYINCRFCFSKKIYPVINLGDMPLAGGFIRAQQSFKNEKFYPLEISFCQKCFLLQSTNVVDADILFKNYFYHSSAIKTLTEHFTGFADEMAKKLSDKGNSLIVEIGSNDGVLINQLLKRNINALGVDPATNIVKPLIKKGLPIMNDYFSENLAKKIVKKNGNADIICSFNAMAHIENMHDILKGIKILLKKDGVLIFETHYLGNLLKEIQYDIIYHEHQYYYSLLTLQNFFANYDMEIFDVKPIHIHAGSMRYYVQNKNTGKYTVSKNVEKALNQERQLKIGKVETYRTFAENISQTKSDLLQLLHTLKEKNKTIAGYGASGRGTIIMNYCGLDKKYLDYVIDDAPAKQGAFTPGNHLKIISSDILLTTQKPDYIVLFAWSFIDEIKKRNRSYLENGGKFIMPLPKVKIIQE